FLGLKNIPRCHLDSYWLLMEISHKTGPRKERKELKMGNISTRMLYVVRTEDIYQEDDPHELLYLFTSLKKPAPLFRQIILECYLNLPPGRSREIFHRLSLGEDIYTLTEESGLSQKELYLCYEAAVNELMEKKDVVIDNLKMKYELIEKINRQEKINRRLVNSIENREGRRSGFYDHLTSGQLTPTQEVFQKLSLTFIDIGLSYAIRRVLALNGIETVTELLKVFKQSSPTYLLTFDKFGKKSLNILKQKLVEAGLVDDNFESEYYDYV
ncbi:MAG: hypothetical protein LUD74_03840, partial [Tannerellaceae bacterium]|nr:hypothetical protein [Tannerellaceae bacterium]